MGFEGCFCDVSATVGAVSREEDTALFRGLVRSGRAVDEEDVGSTTAVAVVVMACWKRMEALPRLYYVMLTL